MHLLTPKLVVGLQTEEILQAVRLSNGLWDIVKVADSLVLETPVVEEAAIIQLINQQILQDKAAQVLLL
jgi:hypothetical protein